MSHQIESEERRGVLDPESGLEALRQSSAFQGPVEAPDEPPHANDHFALVYEDRDEQFAAVIPFIHQGLERGEQCLYVADDNSRADVLGAMREGGIDVDAALDSGALVVQTKEDTYHRTGAFDRDAMVEFWKHALERATEAEYTGLRAAAEMTWALDGDTSLDKLAEYEAILNDIYEGEDYAVLCQYNRERFPADVIHDIVRTHPLIVHDGAVNHNAYYLPPEEFLGPDRRGHEVDQLLDTLGERTETKLELKQRTEHVHRIFENSHDAIFIIDPEADEIIDANPAAAEMLGYSRDQLLRRNPSNLHPDELDRFRDFVSGVFDDGSGWTDELTCHTKDRGRIPAEISATVIEYDDRPVMLASVRDISERKERERAQRKLYEIAADPDRPFEGKLDAMLELGCDRFDLEFGGLAKVDPDRDVFEVDVINQSHDHLVPGKQYPLSETYCRAVERDGDTAAINDPVAEGFEGKLCYEQFGVRAYLGTFIEIHGGQDRTFWFLSNEPREEGFSEAERTFHHLMGQWVKYELERQQRERELRERTEHLSAVIETTPDCIKTVAADGTLLQMNPAGLELGDADSESEVLGECVYDFVAPEDRQRYREFNERICQGERGTITFDIIGLAGTRRHVETHAAPLRRPDETIDQVAVTRDITDQVERKAELRETITQLEQSNDRLQQFAYAASHDLQEPLRMVSSYLQLLESQYQGTLDEEAREFIDFAVDGADRMRAMVDDLLAYSRIEQGDGVYEPVDCESLLDRVQADLRVHIEEADAEIQVASLPSVLADGEQLEQVFLNLVSNAIKYSRDDPPAIEITAHRRGDDWEFTVSDNGIGIEPEKTDRIFQVFKRLHHDDEYPGTGIGLSLCQEIVEHHGGDIWVESEPGVGSTFYFTIPATEDY